MRFKEKGIEGGEKKTNLHSKNPTKTYICDPKPSDTKTETNKVQKYCRIQISPVILQVAILDQDKENG